MKRLLFLNLIFVFALTAYGQNQSFDGFYSVSIIDFFGSTKIIQGNFEVKTGIISGTLKTLPDFTFSGKIEKSGKFKAQTVTTNGTTYIIKGKLPQGSSGEKVEFTEKTVVKGKGSKTVSENSIFGTIKKAEPPPPESVYEDLKTPETGETMLCVTYSNHLFCSIYKTEISVL